MIEHQTRMGHVLRESLRASGWRIVNTTPLPLVCFTRDGLDTTEVSRRSRERQIAWMSEARIGGTPVVRACITSFQNNRSRYSVGGGRDESPGQHQSTAS